MSTQETDVLIVGSGPNALSLAAHLRARDVEHRIFGPPMKFWRDMPRGLNLKSDAFATNIYAPQKGFTLPEWCRSRGIKDIEPCPMETFAEYGLWCQERLVPHLEDIAVTHATTAGRGFEITTADGTRQRGRRIVFATGLSGLAKIPDCLRDMPHELASHTFDNHDFERYRGKKVAVIGAGASAIEAGVLVHEAGGTAQVFVRESEVVIHGKTERERSLYQRLRYPNSVLGPSPKNWALEHFPHVLHFLPDQIRIRFLKKTLGPASPWWIKDRLEGNVAIRPRTHVTHAEPRGSGMRLTVSEEGKGQSTVDVDHVICGTGYELNLDRLAYIDPALRARFKRIVQAPALSRHFQSSVKGAYFMGPLSALSFGPLFRFVAGAKCAAPTLASHLAGGTIRVREESTEKMRELALR